MYPGTIFNWHDLSAIQTSQVSSVIDNAPLFIQAFSSDMGPEEMKEVDGSNFNSLYGTMNFAKHGQSAIQAQRIVDAGGRLLAKRVVADDATLANVVFFATVSADGTNAKIKWESKTYEGCKTFDAVKTKAMADLDDATGKYPVFIFTDNGRGISKKAIRITPDYQTSKTIGKTFFTVAVYQGTTITEQQPITIDPSVIYLSTAYRLDEHTMEQVTGLVDEEIFDMFVDKIAEITGKDANVIRNYDLINAYTYSGAPIEFKNEDGTKTTVTVDTESLLLDADTGLLLENGTNGVFGKYPAKNTGTDETPSANFAAWTTALTKFFSGETDINIYDVDTYKVAAVVDANYPFDVKVAITNLVNFRKDCVFFRDYGLNLNTFIEIKSYYDRFEEHRSRFVMDYATSYQIKDPTTYKNIDVTMTYDLAYALVNHIANKPNAPIAGTVNGFVLPSAIAGTVSFTPIITPTVNQKQAMEDIRVNYAIFQEGQCVVQSCYTSQTAYTQLSYGNNVLAIQQVLRAVRTSCPKQRYSLASSNDLSAYATAVNNVLAEFKNNFDILRFTYTSDALKASQKIFYASIEFAFLNWSQTEIFDIYAINNEE